jgi:hypothetical protein
MAYWFFQVGHLERFNLAFLGAVEQLDNPLFIESHHLTHVVQM